MKGGEKMPVEITPRSGFEVGVSDAKEFSMPGLEIENIIPRPACAAPPCRGCKRPCARGMGEELPLIKNVSTKK